MGRFYKVSRSTLETFFFKKHEFVGSWISANRIPLRRVLSISEVLSSRGKKGRFASEWHLLLYARDLLGGKRTDALAVRLGRESAFVLVVYLIYQWSDGIGLQDGHSWVLFWWGGGIAVCRSTSREHQGSSGLLRPSTETTTRTASTGKSSFMGRAGI